MESFSFFRCIYTWHFFHFLFSLTKLLSSPILNNILWNARRNQEKVWECVHRRDHGHSWLRQSVPVLALLWLWRSIWCWLHSCSSLLLWWLISHGWPSVLISNGQSPSFFQPTIGFASVAQSKTMNIMYRSSWCIDHGSFFSHTLCCIILQATILSWIHSASNFIMQLNYIHLLPNCSFVLQQVGPTYNQWYVQHSTLTSWYFMSINVKDIEAIIFIPFISDSFNSWRRTGNESNIQPVLHHPLLQEKNESGRHKFIRMLSFGYFFLYLSEPHNNSPIKIKMIPQFTVQTQKEM